MTTLPLIRAADAALASAVEENLFALFRAVATLPGSEIVEGDRLSYHRAFPDGAMFKSVWRAHLSVGDVDSEIERAIDWFRAHGESFLAWWFNQHPQPSNLFERLQAHGFELDYDAPGMALALDTLGDALPMPDGFTVVPALDLQTLGDWADVLSATYGFSRRAGRAWVEATLAFGPENAPWRLYVGYWRGRPVATNMVFNGAGVAGLYCIGTLPDARGRGFGAAVTMQPLFDSRAQGYHYAVLFASDMGLPLYEKLGFRRVDMLIGRYVRHISP